MSAADCTKCRRSPGRMQVEGFEHILAVRRGDLDALLKQVSDASESQRGRQKERQADALFLVHLALMRAVSAMDEARVALIRADDSLYCEEHSDGIGF